MHNLPSKKTTGMQHRKEISYAARYSKCAYILSTFAGIWRPMWIFSCVLKKLFGNRRITMTSMGYDTVLQQSTSCWHRYGQRWKRLKRRRYWWGYSWLLCVALRCVGVHLVVGGRMPLSLPFSTATISFNFSVRASTIFNDFVDLPHLQHSHFNPHMLFSAPLQALCQSRCRCRCRRRHSTHARIKAWSAFHNCRSTNSNNPNERTNERTNGGFI